jgi:hypothetical protein
VQRLVMTTPVMAGPYLQTPSPYQANPLSPLPRTAHRSACDTVSDSYYAVSLSPVTTFVPNCSRKASLTHSPPSQCHHSFSAYPKTFATPRSHSSAGAGICYRTHPRYAALTAPRAHRVLRADLSPKLIQQIALFLKSKKRAS